MEKSLSKTVFEPKLSPENTQLLLDAIKRETAVPTVELEAVRGPLSVYDSKFGGVPYLPPDFSYPVSARTGTPLKLLAQLNFALLPSLPDFPRQGILQFYVNAINDDLYGADFDNPTEQKDFRVVYHKTVLEDASLLQTPPKIQEEDLDFPFEGEFRLLAKLGTSYISNDSCRYDTVFSNVAEKLFHETVEAGDLDDEADKLICEELTDFVLGHRIGGYPFFTQSDPREYAEELRGHSVLLLQIDSDGDGEDEILWGDCGVANFFIRPEDLKNCDFSNILYNWDCC